MSSNGEVMGAKSCKTVIRSNTTGQFSNGEVISEQRSSKGVVIRSNALSINDRVMV